MEKSFTQSLRCTATTRKGQPCRAWAVPGTDPPRCAAHGGVASKPGAPSGNQNAVTHGFYARNWGMGHRTAELGSKLPPDGIGVQNLNQKSSVPGEDAPGDQDDLIIANSLTEVITYVTEDLVNKYIVLSKYINKNFEELSPPAMTHLLSLHAQMASRIGRLLRDQKAIEPDGSSELQQAIDLALDELSGMLGTEL